MAKCLGKHVNTTNTLQWNFGASKDISLMWFFRNVCRFLCSWAKTKNNMKNRNCFIHYYIYIYLLGWELKSSVYNVLAGRLNWGNGTLMHNDVIAMFRWRRWEIKAEMYGSRFRYDLINGTKKPSRKSKYSANILIIVYGNREMSVCVCVFVM